MGYREPLSNDSDTLQSNEKQSNSLLPDDEDLSLEGLALSDRQREAFNKLDMANQLVIIRALREQQGVEKPKPKKEEQEKSELDVLREKVEKANREIKIADNEREGVKSDVEVEEDNEEKELKIDYSKYGKGFSREFIDELVLDDEFNNIVKDYLIPNEGGYNNDEDDSGGETNMGISKTTHKNEDIKKMTRERANAIFYRDFYKINGLNKLPYKIRGFIVDFGVLSSPINAIRMVHKILNLSPKGTIIGKDTLDKFKNFTHDDYESFLGKYKLEMINYFNKIVENNPSQKKYLKGWINRANRAHLAK